MRIEEFIEAVEASQNGEISKDELLTRVHNIVSEMNPKIPDETCLLLARGLIEGFDIDELTWNVKTIGRRLPDGTYTFPDKMTLELGPYEERKTEISHKTRVKLDKLLAKVDELIPPVETLRLKPSRGSTTVFDSKMGGVPYFPKDMEYPTVREGENAGKPLKFLAQLNFGSLPEIKGFPSEGILQFFIFPDDLSGADYDNLTKQNGFRVIYHENVSDDTAALIESAPEVEFEEYNFPFKGEFLLIAENVEKMPVTEYDFRFTEYCPQAYNELFNRKLKSIYDIYNADRPISDALYDTRAIIGTRMGGYPHFEQEDPRGYKDELAGHTVLLFQSDSESGGEGWDNQICWGDMGVANFFITPEDLSKRDFSNVLYTWDCG